jgi:hypothetical protein
MMSGAVAVWIFILPGLLFLVIGIILSSIIATPTGLENPPLPETHHG